MILSRPIRALLRVPLEVKIVVANVAIAALACLLVVTVGTLEGALAGGALVVGINTLIVRAALAPLRRLEEAARLVEGGRIDVRSPGSSLADREIARLVHAFNGALDRQDEYRQRLRELALRSLRSDEARSRRLAVALREGAGQRLASVLMRLHACRGPDCDPAVAAGLVQEARAEIASAVELLTAHSGDRAERLLEDLGMGKALEWRAGQLRRSHGLEVFLDVAGLPRELPGGARLALFHILDEALENAGRHARARCAVVTVGAHGPHLTAEVRDDGRGFRLDEERSAGLGLLAMEERAAAVGGALRIETVPARGTRVRVEIPLPAPPLIPTNGSPSGSRRRASAASARASGPPRGRSRA